MLTTRQTRLRGAGRKGDYAQPRHALTHVKHDAAAAYSCNRTGGGVHLLHSEKRLAAAAAADRAAGVPRRPPKGGAKRKHAHTHPGPCFSALRHSSYKHLSLLSRVFIAFILLFFCVSLHIAARRASRAVTITAASGAGGGDGRPRRSRQRRHRRSTGGRGRRGVGRRACRRARKRSERRGDPPRFCRQAVRDGLRRRSRWRRRVVYTAEGCSSGSSNRGVQSRARVRTRIGWLVSLYRRG